MSASKRTSTANEAAAAYLLYRMIDEDRSCLVIVPDLRTAETFVDNLQFFFRGRGPAVGSFFGWETLPFDMLSPAIEISAERLSTLARLAQQTPLLVVATVDALMQRIVGRESLAQASFVLHCGAPFQREEIARLLICSGYSRSSLVEERGQFVFRGAVVDIFPGGEPLPLRFEVFDDTIQSIRSFDPATQRSIADKDSLVVFPVRECLLSAEERAGAARRLRERGLELEIPERLVTTIEEAILSAANLPGIEHYHPFLARESATFWDYFPAAGQVTIWNEAEVRGSAEQFAALIEERSDKLRGEGQLFPPPEQCYLTASWLDEQLRNRETYVINPRSALVLGTDISPAESAPDSTGETADREVLPNSELHHQLRVARHSRFPFRPLADEINRSLDYGSRVAIVVSQEHRVKRVGELLHSYQIDAEHSAAAFDEWLLHPGEWSKTVTILHGTVTSGFKAPADRLQLIDDTEIFPEISGRRRASSASTVHRVLGTLSQLKENDFIVHVDHGIGCYRGLKQMTVEGHVGDFLALEYAEGAKLFVPVENIGKVQKYIGAEGIKPALNRLGAPAWTKAKRTVEEAISELAGQLIHLYAAREIAAGVSFGSRDEDDLRFADTFPFEETADQQRAIEEVLLDMAKERPMDRLVCGDVGYGKTEVALRAAFKAVNRGKQVALLVPTTVLADQHLKTFQERFAEYPFRIGSVSRFFSAAENKNTLAGLQGGQVDMVIGTHRLLQKDVFFKDLGLVIVDEEHRFGVAHKEKLKRFRREVDVLTLTATPIPRTLHMSLLGLRDLSVIETPPVDRHMIKTYVATYQPALAREAILREIGRSGQVFYIHNRVENIAQIAREVQELVPEAKVAFGHGQMKESELETIMHRFIAGEINVLVSTTIVESGLDISNANTIIIRKAEAFGLAELYQLRGRVGRSSRRAYAYLLIGNKDKLGPEAKKRLQVLQSLDDLGMGFRLAVQDMEIRGAGNLLGKDQSGNVNLVGFEMYSRILKNAIRELQLRGQSEDQTLRPDVDPELHVGFSAYIPAFYIPDVEERLVLYQRLVDLQNRRQGQELLEEFYDRFGRPPKEVMTLIEVMVLKSLLRQALIVSATLRKDAISLHFHPQARLDPKDVLKLIEKSEGKIRLSPEGVLSIRIEPGTINSPMDLYDYLVNLLASLHAVEDASA